MFADDTVIPGVKESVEQSTQKVQQHPNKVLK